KGPRQQSPEATAGRSSSQRSTGYEAIRFSVFFAGLLDDFGRQRRGGRLLVPTNGFQMIPHVLLVERRLRAARIVAGARPEAGRIGRENLIGEHKLVANEAELELRVRDDDATRFSVAGGTLINI